MTGFVEERKKNVKKIGGRSCKRQKEESKRQPVSQPVKASPLSEGGTRRGRIKNTEGQKLKTKVSRPWGQRGGGGKDEVSM